MEVDDRSAELKRLFRQTFRRVMAYCLRRTGETAAHDVVAEVYAVAWRRRRRLPSDEADEADERRRLSSGRRRPAAQP